MRLLGLGFAVALCATFFTTFTQGAGQRVTVQMNEESDEPYIDPARKAMALRALNRAVDDHVHVDMGGVAAIDIAKMKRARKLGMRGMVLHSHHMHTHELAFMARKEVPGLELIGMTVLNPDSGGINVHAVEWATKIGGYGGQGLARFVSFPTSPGYVPEDKPVPTHQVEGVTVTDKNKLVRNGELTPEVKAIIALIVKNNFTLWVAHATPKERLMLIREAHRQRELAKKDPAEQNAELFMVYPQEGFGTAVPTVQDMQEAVKLGAFIDFDSRDLSGVERDGPVVAKQRRAMQMLKQVGAKNAILHGYWTNRGADRGMIPGTEEYAGLEGIADLVELLHLNGFMDADIDLMMKVNPAKLLGLPATLKEQVQ